MKCDLCNREKQTDRIYELNVCGMCFREYFPEQCAAYNYCAQCRKPFHSDKLVHLFEEDISVCLHCLEHYFVLCPECDEYHRESDCHYKGKGEYVCNRCYNREPNLVIVYEDLAAV